MADDPFLRHLPADSRPHPMPFQADKRPDRTADMVALRPSRPHHRPLDAALLLQRAVIHLDPPGELGILQSFPFVPLEIIRRPIFRVPGWGDDPDYANHPVIFQVDDRPRLGNRAVAHRAVARPIRIDQPIRAQLCQPPPATIPNQPHAAHRYGDEGIGGVVCIGVAGRDVGVAARVAVRGSGTGNTADAPTAAVVRLIGMGATEPGIVSEPCADTWPGAGICFATATDAGIAMPTSRGLVSFLTN